MREFGHPCGNPLRNQEKKMNNKLSNFPKIECPFVRERISRKQYLVTNKIVKDYEWVFNDSETIAVEKLNGTNVKLQTENGQLIILQNRKNVIDPLHILGRGGQFIVEGVFTAIQKGYVKDNEIQAGEIIGPKLQGNPYKLTHHVWYPFDKAIESLKYKSFHEHERTLDNFSAWFKDDLKSLFHAKQVGFENAVFAEGVVFYNLKRKAEGKIYMAKLRRDMFDWFYK
jgi:hypothetical protein